MLTTSADNAVGDEGWRRLADALAVNAQSVLVDVGFWGSLPLFVARLCLTLTKGNGMLTAALEEIDRRVDNEQSGELPSSG